MKKFSLLFAMVFATCLVIGQTAIVNQTSSITVPQSIQTATVTQTGLSTVNIMQNTEKMEYDNPNPDFPVKFDHTAIATQSGGDANNITISQIADEHINGGSYNNVSEATQVGTSNTMSQTQISGNWTSGGMKFKSYQEGQENNGVQYGKKTETTFDLYQNGNQNISQQQTTGEKTGVLVGAVKQIGDRNNSTQLFHGENVRYAGAFIDQNGSDNKAIQEFSSLITLWNDPSHADIIQRNNNNYAYQSQIGQGSYQKTEQYGTFNNSSMYSHGNFNNAYSYQDGINGIIVIDQKQTAVLGGALDGNLAKIYQNGDHSEAYIMQNGLRNKVVGLNADDYAININDSYLNVNQTGNDNLVRSSQTVSSAMEIVNQVGNGNISIVNQY